MSKGRVTRRALYLLLGCAMAAIPQLTAHAATPSPATQVIDSDAKFAELTQGHRVKALIQMIRVGRHELADRLLNSYPFKGKHAVNRTLFIEGMILKAGGNNKGAIANYRRALADDPKLSLVRMELAHTLYLTEQDDGAKHHLSLLRDSAPSVDTAKQFDQFIDNIDARSPWSLDAYFSLAPSTNFNNGTSERIVILNGESATVGSNSFKKSGIGIRGGANGSYTLRTEKGVDLIASAGVNLTEYSGRTFDDIIISQSLAVQQHTKKGTVTGSVIATQRWSGPEEFSWTIGPQISLRQQVAPKVTLFSKLRHSIIDYKRADYRNGHKTSLDNRLSYSFSDATVGYLIASGERSISKRKHNDYWAASAGLGLYYEASYGISIYSEARIRQQWHEGLYPFLTGGREDTRLEFNVSLTKRDFDIYGVTPRLHYSYIKNFSNSVIDRYETHGVNLTLTRQF